MFKKSFIESNGLKFQALKRSNDLFFVYSALVLANRITYHNKKLVNYRVNIPSSLQSTNTQTPLDFYEALSALQCLLKDKGIYQQTEKSFTNLALSNIMYNIEKQQTDKSTKEVADLFLEKYIFQYDIEGKPKDYFNQQYYKKYIIFLTHNKRRDLCDEIYKKVSVIIPVYNVEEYLGKCLESVINQTIGLENLEIIIVNDGSTDNSLKIAQQYKSKYDDIILVNQENMGLGEARNSGLAHVTSEYTTFLDSDDHLPLDAYEKLYDGTEDSTIDIVYGKMAYIGLDGVTHHTTFADTLKPGEYEKIIDPRIDKKHWEIYIFGSACYRIFKTNLITDNKLKFPGRIYMEDIPFTTIANLLANKVKAIDHVVYFYMFRNESIMRSKKNKKAFLDSFKAIEFTYKNIEKYNLGEYKPVFNWAVLNNHLPYLKRLDELIDRSCIDIYNLSQEEYESAASLLKEIIKGLDLEVMSGLDAKYWSIYFNAYSKLKCDEHWLYYQTIGSSNPFVSVIVPVYNVEKYLFDCLQSIEQQTLKNIEVIIVDDGSPDNSYLIAEEFVSRNSNFHLYRKENGGLGSARNHGMKYAKGKYILFLDSDDILPPRACELLGAKAIENDSDVVFGRTVWKYKDRTEPVEYLEKWYKFNDDKNFKEEYMFAIGATVATAKLLRTELLRKNNIEFMHIIGEDVPFSVQVFYYASIISVEKGIVYLRTDREDDNKSITQTFNSRTIKERIIGLEFIDKFCLDKNMLDVRSVLLWQVKNLNIIFVDINGDSEKELAFQYIKAYLAGFQNKNDRSTISNNVGFDIDTLDSLSCEEYEQLVINIQNSNREKSAQKEHTSEAKQGELSAEQQLKLIHSSRAWKIVMLYYKIMNKIKPKKH